MKLEVIRFELEQTVQHPTTGRFENMKPCIALVASLGEGDDPIQVKKYLEEGVQIMMKESVGQCKKIMLADVEQTTRAPQIVNNSVSSPQGHQSFSQPPAASHTPQQPTYQNPVPSYAPQGSAPATPVASPQYPSYPQGQMLPVRPGDLVA